ncbi:MAG TPA: dihydrodipicolinate synthase family protein, partial [Acetobacteraceae bacterium]|nr:dihydrodipicolinate synthase family protein [Acetobacteraceae bacterium]
MKSKGIAGLSGIVPPVLTPLTDRFAVDYPSFTRVIEHLIAGGAHGLFFLGSTGEVVFHDEATRQGILEHAVRVVGGRVPVLAGVVDPTTDRMIGHARRAAAAGADAIVVTAPFYTRTSQPEIVDHFRYVAEDAGLPVIAYDIPVCVHVKLDRATIATLAREGTIAGLK